MEDFIGTKYLISQASRFAIKNLKREKIDCIPMRLEARFTRLVECYIKAFARTEPEKKDKQAA